MDVNKTKFERNSPLEHCHITCIGKTKHKSQRGLVLSLVTNFNERLGDGINKVFNVYHSDSTHSLCKFDRCANVVESMRESSFLARLL